MAASIFFAFLILASVVSFNSGRFALLLVLIVGFTQDAVRKLTPGEPIIFIVTVGVVFAAVLVGIWMRHGFAYSFEPFLRWSEKIRTPLLLFFLVLVLQFIYSIVQYQNLIVGLIGLITYVAPFLAVIVGYYLATNSKQIRAFFKLYAVAGVIVALSVVASFSGYDLTILNEVGLGIKIYDQGTVLKSHAGIMRTGEVAAWHLATAACMWLTLAMTSTKGRTLWISLLIVAFLLVGVALTGRRKMLMLFALYSSGYFTALMYYRNTLNAKYFINILLLLVSVWVGYEVLNLDGYDESLRNYIARSSTVFADASGRFVDLGITPIQWAYNRVGIFGGGLGIASQGSYMFNVANVAGGSGEGGLGKIMVELGLPGLLIIVWLMVVLSMHVDRCLRLSTRANIDPLLLPITLSLSVLLAANAMTFSVATQVYGDIFILILMGLMGGFIFALPKMAALSLQSQSAQRAAGFA